MAITEIPRRGVVLILGSSLGSAVVFGLGPGSREAGSCDR